MRMNLIRAAALLALVLTLWGCDISDPPTACQPGEQEVVISTPPGEEIPANSENYRKVWAATLTKCPGQQTAVLQGEMKSSATFLRVWVRGRLGNSNQYASEAAGDWDGFWFEWDLSGLRDGSRIRLSLWVASEGGTAAVRNIRAMIE